MHTQYSPHLSLRAWPCLVALLGAFLALRTPDRAQGQIYSGPIVISAGGTYSGNWESQDPNTPAVKVDTSDPVTIQNSNIRSRGACIYAPNTRTHMLTVLNTYGQGLNPNVAGASPGRFVHVDYAKKLVVENCYFENTAGIDVNGYSGDRSADQTIRIRYNRAHNIDGRFSLGAGGGFSTSGFARVQFLQLLNMSNVPGVEVAWNEIINSPHSSRVEDNINFYHTSGGSSAPITVHDNFIWGAYTALPESDTYSGGGIISDGGNNTTVSTAPGFLKVYNNQLVSTTNYGVGIYAGHDCEYSGNKMVSSGALPDGVPIAAQNTGMYLWDSSNDASRGTFFNNTEHDNQSGWTNLNGSAPARNDWWTPSPTAVNNGRLAGSVTLDTEKAELIAWWSKLLGASQRLGPAGSALLYEAEHLTPAATSGDTHRVIRDDSFHGGYGAIYDANGVGDYVTYTFYVPEIRPYAILVGTKTFSTRGIFQFAIASTTSGTYTNHGSPQDGYAATSAYTELNCGTFTPATVGNKAFRLTVTGKNASSAGYSLCVDYIKLAPQ